MPAKKKDPVEQKREAVKAKLYFVMFTVLLLILGNALITKQDAPEIPSVEKKAQESIDVLVQDSVDQEKELVSKVQTYVAETQDQVEEQTGEVLSETKTRVSDTVSGLIYKTTLEPLINKIQALPEDQRVYVKEAICREIQDEDVDTDVDGGP